MTYQLVTVKWHLQIFGCLKLLTFIIPCKNSNSVYTTITSNFAFQGDFITQQTFMYKYTNSIFLYFQLQPQYYNHSNISLLHHPILSTHRTLVFALLSKVPILEDHDLLSWTQLAKRCSFKQSFQLKKNLNVSKIHVY